MTPHEIAHLMKVSQVAASGLSAQPKASGSSPADAPAIPDTFECPHCGANGILEGEYCPRNCHLLYAPPQPELDLCSRCRDHCVFELLDNEWVSQCCTASPISPDVD